MRSFLRDQLAGWRSLEVLWLAFCLISVCALSLYWGDNALGVTAAATGMIYTVLAGKGKISCFLFGLVNTPIYAYLSYCHGYYGDMALNIYYFVMMFPALASWWRNRSQNAVEGVFRTRLRLRESLLLSLVCAVLTVLLWRVLAAFGGSRPFCDALTDILSVAAMFLTVRRAIEQWLLWIAVDLIEVFMWWKVWSESGNSISLLLMWLLFLVNGVWLFILWLRASSADRLRAPH